MEEIDVMLDKLEEVLFHFKELRLEKESLQRRVNFLENQNRNLSEGKFDLVQAESTMMMEEWASRIKKAALMIDQYDIRNRPLLDIIFKS